MAKNDWNLEGQMSIFDFLEPEKEEVAAVTEFDLMTIEQAAEIITSR